MRLVIKDDGSNIINRDLVNRDDDTPNPILTVENPAGETRSGARASATEQTGGSHGQRYSLGTMQG